MKVSRTVWQERANNLLERRATGVITSQFKEVDDYGAHIRKAYIGKTVLDVGCGSMVIQKHLPKDTVYTGIDPFPESIMEHELSRNQHLYAMDIEECTFKDNSFETVYAFAMLDNVYDLKRAVDHMKRVCSKNILILTGINISPDKYHTIEITEQILTELMLPFKVGYKATMHPKIMLIEFLK